MPKSAKVVRLTTVLTKMEHEFGWHWLPIEGIIAKKLGFEGKLRRVVCTLNGKHTFQCALLPSGGQFYIIVNKQIRDKLGIAAGDKVKVELSKDESKYGLPMPKEFREVLKQDRDGDRLFHGLTPGKQRTILYYVGKTKDIDRRIHMALVIVEHLKNNDGKIIYPKLAEELKRPIFES
jgi:bifunctional DNA-binding transcriptional regulator/antitoxin component of YhaV-PrlF toxin-antitoxin module